MKGPINGPRLEAGTSRIAGRTAGGWIVGDRFHVPALLITGTHAWSLPGQTLNSIDLAGLPELDGAELLLLGTGATLIRPPSDLVEAGRKRGWRIEAMDRAAAARTFNVLVAEGRLVAALIL